MNDPSIDSKPPQHIDHERSSKNERGTDLIGEFHELLELPSRIPHSMESLVGDFAILAI